jgi:cytochrome c-type biogenesis protein CcmF
VAQLLKFKKNKTSALKPILISAILATLLSAILYYYFSIPGLYYSLLLFAACYGLIANTWHMLPMLRAKILSMGASVAHIGFAVLLIGVLVSSANKKVISINDTGMMLNPEFDEKSNREHLLLEKGKNYKMGDYELSYISDSTHWVNTYYNVHYKKLNADNSVYYEFDLYPNAQINPKMGLVANPDTKHYLSHDVFTYVSSVPKEKSTKSFVKQQLHTIKPGDSVITDFGIIKLLSVKSSLSAEQIDKLNKNSNTEQLDLRNMQVLLTADIQLFTLNGTFAVKPIYGLNKDQVLQFEDYADNGNYRFIFTGVNPKDGSVTIESSIKDTSSDFIIMKAIVFPWINLVWSGTIIMIIGFLMSIVKRWKVLSA